MGPKATEWPKADDREAGSVQEKGWWAWLARQGVLAVLRARTPSPDLPGASAFPALLLQPGTPRGHLPCNSQAWLFCS